MNQSIEKMHDDLVTQLHDWSARIVSLMKPSSSAPTLGQGFQHDGSADRVSAVAGLRPFGPLGVPRQEVGQ